LGRFLTRLVTHPDLKLSKSLDVFLTATRDEFNASRDTPAQEKSGSSSSSSFFNNVLSSVTSLATSLTTTVQEVDRSFTDQQFYIETLQEKLEILLDAVGRDKELKTELANNTVELARAVESLEKQEKKKSQRLAEYFSKLSETLSATSALENTLFKNEEEKVEDIFKEQTRFTSSALRILEHRQDILKQYQIAQNTTKAKQDKVAGTDTEALELAKAQEHEEELKVQFEAVSSNVKEQLGVFKDIKSKEFRLALLAMAKENIEYGEQSIALWKDMGRALESSPRETK